MKPISSAISGTARRAQQAASSTGAQHGATGFDLTLSADPSREMHQVVMARLPTSNTAAALSRMQQFGVQCSVKMETVFPTLEDGDTTFRQRPTSLTLDIGSSADLEAALRVANESLAPASVQQIEEWLAELSVKTARRKASEMGAELALSVYTGALRGYPADAVRHVLSSYRGQWFPTWGELADRLDELTEPRLMIRDRLVAILKGEDTPKLEAKPKNQRIADLKEELAALNRIALKYPEAHGQEAEEMRQLMIEEIQQLEGTR